MSDSDLDEQETHVGGIYVVDNIIENVWALQKSISPKAKNGDSLSTLVNALEKNDVDPLTDDRLILNVALAKVRCHPHRQRHTRFYTSVSYTHLTLPTILLV